MLLVPVLVPAAEFFLARGAFIPVLPVGESRHARAASIALPPSLAGEIRRSRAASIAATAAVAIVSVAAVASTGVNIVVETTGLGGGARG